MYIIFYKQIRFETQIKPNYNTSLKSDYRRLTQLNFISDLRLTIFLHKLMYICTTRVRTNAIVRLRVTSRYKSSARALKTNSFSGPVLKISEHCIRFCSCMLSSRRIRLWFRMCFIFLLSIDSSFVIVCWPIVIIIRFEKIWTFFCVWISCVFCKKKCANILKFTFLFLSDNVSVNMYFFCVVSNHLFALVFFSNISMIHLLFVFFCTFLQKIFSLTFHCPFGLSSTCNFLRCNEF